MNMQFRLLIVVAAIWFCGTASAAVVDPNVDPYYVRVDLLTRIYDPWEEGNLGVLDQTYASDTLFTPDSTSNAIASGSADISTAGAAIRASAQNSSNNYYADALSSIKDTVTFHVPGGGSATVVATISGLWSVSGTNTDTFVEYVFWAGPTLYSGMIDPYSATSSAITIGGYISDGWTGSYFDGGAWTVQDGQAYSVTALVHARSSSPTGGSVWITDPVTFGLPSGVTLTSASGNTYSVAAVPLPAAVWLFGSGLLGLIGASRRK